MRKRNRHFHICCALLAFLISACTTKVSPTNATLESNVYKNHFFNFQMQVPQGWTIGNKQDFDEAMAAGSSGKNLKLTKEAEKISHLLLLASETPAGTPAESNPAIVLMAVDLAGEPAIQNAKDYETLVIKSLTEKDKTYKQVNDPFLVKLGTKEFYRVDLKVDVLGRIMHEAFFATLEKRYALILTVTADSEADANKILTVAGFPQIGK